ncbi:uncharacterized protein (TIGR02611 family) [Friedmanniella endophytica]|uniref:Uncharacterized protein (TIGR02611 family) n=1 Tax=Microlunatus kandeliicorticis TaxID=1759536 RepID=A0A7W3ITJ1_9ACTN|nr:PGPGW domain-containing protein [Microlunatus kandeliicorticis]MBA8794993.1 uncharacterized protein (TIGR02611 family) [Microlunatus kandeliicorticis]
MPAPAEDSPPPGGGASTRAPATHGRRHPPHQSAPGHRNGRADHAPQGVPHLTAAEAATAFSADVLTEPLPPDASPRERRRFHRRRENEHLLRERQRHDRWHWRRKVRADPRMRVVYRFLIGMAGLLLIVAGLVTGPLPGPGGIPLVLLGLAVWASEFIWAHRLMQRFKAAVHWFGRLSRRRKVAIIGGIVLVVLGAGWGALVVAGVPGWVPEPVNGWLRALPAV